MIHDSADADMIKRVKNSILAIAALFSALHASAALELGSPFADGMVLQREREVPVWGTADAGAKVSVSFAGFEVSSVAGADGRWKVFLPAMKACGESRVMIVRAGAELKRISDVLVGEVWYVSGQSNAECPLWNNPKDGNNPRFRDRNGALTAQMTYRPRVRMCYASNYRTSDTPRERAVFPVKWEAFTPATLAEGHGFSAIGVYFALEIHDAIGVPVGIVGSYWGGTRIEPWIPAEGFASIGIDPACDEISLKNDKGQPRNAEQLPSRLWNEMVNPFAPMAMRGFIWYQGCSNSGDVPVERYARMMHALYNGWSKKFENPSLKLYFVQLAPWGGGGHPEFQQVQQRFAEAEPNAAMAVINDLGNLTDIHPNEKEYVARRLAVHALKRDYGFDAIEDESPKLRSWRIEGDRFVMTFDHAKSFYIYNERYCSQENGFEICGADGVWKPGRIHRFIRHGGNGAMYGGIDGGNVLEVSADGVSEPKKLRYLYSRPWYGSLYNHVCLPLGSFHIDSAGKSGGTVKPPAPPKIADETTTAVVPSERGRTLAEAGDGWNWIDCMKLKLEGRPFADADFYCRLPVEAKTNVAYGTWAMSRCPAGMSLVFTSTSRKLRVRWSLTSSILAMAHMPATGVSGVDLYRRTDGGEWRFVKSGFPKKQRDNEFEVSIAPGRPYRLYLPLYNGLSSLELGVEAGAKLDPCALPADISRKPVVFYGGSVVQGACVSRPGNAWVNIAGRILDTPTVSMGFNGQGKMIPYEADLLARIDAAAYCFLCLGNMRGENYAEEAESFLRRLRELKPNVPIIFGAYHYPQVENPGKHAFAAKLKAKLRKEDPVKWAKFDIVPLEKMCSADCDGTVDGGHPNDYGAYRMAEAFAAAVKNSTGQAN